MDEATKILKWNGTKWVPHGTPPARPAPLATAMLIATPPLAALAAWSVPQLLTLAEHPAGWLAGIAAAAVGVTALAAAAESRDDDPARTIWPLLLAWPLAFPWYMNRRDRLGSGLAGALLLTAALAWSGWQIQRGHAAADFLLQASGEQKSTQASGEQKMSDARRLHILRARIDAELAAEDAASR